MKNEPKDTKPKKEEGKTDKKFKKLRKIFVTKKGWLWLSALMVGMAAIAYALVVDLYPCGSEIIGWEWWPGIRHRLWQAAGTVCDVIIAYSTMLAAVVIFYYSVTENKRLGVPYRKLMAYSVGSLTIPILFVAILLLTVFLVVSLHIPWKHTAYVSAIYILLLQTCMIIEILRSTSYEYGKKVICRVGRKEYWKEIESGGNYSMSRVYIAGHLERAIHSDEVIEDKKELLGEFLRIPFQKEEGELSCDNFCQEVYTEKKELEKIYQFYFSNISSAFQNLDGREKQVERNELYSCIGAFLKELHKCMKDIERVPKWEDQMECLWRACHMALSGIMNGITYSGVEDNAGFCEYVFSECIPDREMRMPQMRLYVLFQEVVDMVGEKPKQRQRRIRNMNEWEPIKKEADIEFCIEFWDIWFTMFQVPLERKMRRFQAAMQTMTGRSNESVAVLEMLLPIEEG